MTTYPKSFFTRILLVGGLLGIVLFKKSTRARSTLRHDTIVKILSPEEVLALKKLGWLGNITIISLFLSLILQWLVH